MSALEDEIIHKFQLLDREARERVLTELNHQPGRNFDVHDWLERVNALQEKAAAEGNQTRIDVVGLLREVREDND